MTKLTRIESRLASVLSATLKLGGSGNAGAKLDAFLHEFDSKTKPNPFMPDMGVWENSIGFELSKFDDAIHISSITSFDRKNAGNASRGLKWLCELADKHKVKLELFAVPMKNAGDREGKSLTASQLIAWYKRNGFVRDGDDYMIRNSKP